MSAADSVSAVSKRATADPSPGRSGGFVHLHLHSEYSLLDGGNKISRLVARVKELGMNAVAVTDHGNLHGAIEFYLKAREAGIKPILGIEAYVAPGDRTIKKPTGIADGGFHLVLLAEDNIGWRNLLKLSSDSFVTGFYRKPRMDKTTLERWSDGLIAINGHLGSSLAHHLLKFAQTSNQAHWEAAIDEARWHKDVFGTNARGESRFFIELQHHDTPEQERINPHLINLAAALDLPIVGDNDAHYLRAEDWDTHDSLCCISMGKTKADEARMKYSRQLYVKSPEQMAELFRDAPEAVENTVRIAERCNVELDFSQSHAPIVRVVHPGRAPEYDPARDGENVSAWFSKYCAEFELLPFDAEQHPEFDREQLKRECDRALRDLCEAGLIWRYGHSPDGTDPEIRARLERELQILADKHISAYFLIVWDFVNWARQRGIPSNARGSGVGTMVGYVLGLSNACPVKYGLLFERFTDPDRAEYPDIDIDICQDGRSKVIEYVRTKYGHVAQIITFGRLKARAAIKDVARVHGLLPNEGQRLANFIPSELHITIAQALEKEPDLRREYESNPSVRTIIDTAQALEDHARHAGVHAAGVVIATEPLDNIVPLGKATGSDDIVTQWDGPTCEKVGLLKMDFLGLRTLSTIERATQLIRESLSEEAIWRAVARDQRANTDGPASGRAHPLDLERLMYDDPSVFRLFARADTAGVFQFESGGMRRLLADMKPDRLEDLIAANALYRPGPMDLIPAYVDRKHGRAEVPSVHPIVDQFTAETYGIMVYQEQVMQIVHELGGIPLRQAYTLIKAISKKKHDVIDANRAQFLAGAEKNGLGSKAASELFEHILKFAGYGFNKSHSTGYAIVAYQTAYLKTYFPNQYMAAMLTFESAARKVEDWITYLEECRRAEFPDHSEANPHVGVDVRAPDVNSSQAAFAVSFNEGEARDNLHGHVRFGLNAIKNVSRNAIDTLVAERAAHGPYLSMFDFCERLPTQAVSKSTIEALVKAGAFDSLHGTNQRAAVLAALDDAIAAGQSLADDRRSGQMNIFALADDADGAAGEEVSQRPLPNVSAWDKMTKLSFEKDVLGFHVSGHPLDQYDEVLHTFQCASTREVGQRAHDSAIIVGGLLADVRYTFTKRDQKRMAILSLQDRHGSLDVVAFPATYARFAQHMQKDQPVLVAGKVDCSRNEPQVLAEIVAPMQDAAGYLAASLEVTFVQDAARNGMESVESQIEMVSGLLNQCASTGPSEGQRAAAVVVNLHRNDHRISIRSRRLRVVCAGDLLQRVREVVGPAQVRIVPVQPRELLRDHGGPPQRFSSRAGQSTPAMAEV